MNEAERAWLACAIDGEGSLGLRRVDKKKRTISTRVEVGNTDVRFLEYALRITGRGKIYPCASGNPRWKPRFFWVVIKIADCEQILEQILPYLIIKKDRAAQMLLYCKLRRQRGRHRKQGVIDRLFYEGNQTEIENILEML